MTKKLLKTKKAISPILATLLLIVIAVAAIVVTYAWIMTYMSSAGTQAGVILYKANVRFYEESGTKKIDIDVGNSGTSDTQIIQVYIGTSSATLQNQTTSPLLPVSLAAGQIVRLTVQYNWTAGDTYYFKIIPSAGQQPLGPFPEQAPTS
jgi:flagellin-like protein